MPLTQVIADKYVRSAMTPENTGPKMPPMKTEAVFKPVVAALSLK